MGAGHVLTCKTLVKWIFPKEIKKKIFHLSNFIQINYFSKDKIRKAL